MLNWNMVRRDAAYEGLRRLSVMKNIMKGILHETKDFSGADRTTLDDPDRWRRHRHVLKGKIFLWYGCDGPANLL